MVTGIFTLGGVVVTASVALLVAWIKYKTDRHQEFRRERRELYARFHHVGAQLWDALNNIRRAGDNTAEPSPQALRTANDAWGRLGEGLRGDVYRKRRSMTHDRADVQRDAIGLLSETAAIGASRPGTRRRAAGADATRAGTLTAAHSSPAPTHFTAGPSSGRANWREAAVPGCDSPVPSRVGLSCGVCSGPRTEQWKSGEDLLQVHHLTRYELGDGQGDNLGRTVDVGYHAARFGSGEATAVGSQAQLDLDRVDRVDVKVDGHFVAPVVSSQPSSGALVDRSASGLNTLRPHSAAIAGSVGSV